MLDRVETTAMLLPVNVYAAARPAVEAWRTVPPENFDDEASVQLPL